jgi:DNA-binding GntR family transcriptional regulator
MTETGLRARPLTIASMIAQELRARILAGEIPAGARLQQNDVARQFDVSSTPVREAFAELRRQGLVTGLEHRGVRVLRPTLADVIEASEVEELLEGTCIARSAPLLTDADLAGARAILDEHRGVPEGEWQRRLELDTAFHMSLLVRCPNEKLRRLTEAAYQDTMVYRLLLAPMDASAEHLLETIYQQHEAIYSACAGRDGELAAACTVEHIRWGREVFRERARSTILAGPSGA